MKHLARRFARKLFGAARAVADVGAVLAGVASYNLRGNTPASAYQAFIRLFCLSRGRTNDVMNRVVRIVDRGSNLPQPSGLLGIRNVQDAERAAEQIRSDGYYVFQQTLSAQMCDRLLQFALSTPARVRPMKGQRNPTAADAVYQRDKPVAARYDFRADDVINLPDVQGLMADPSLLWVAQSYLRTTPVADVTTMWWHTSFSNQPDEEAAQLYHFDMDRIQWLKFFIYLTDVDADNGPHCFIKGSHRTDGIPSALLTKGYARLQDQEVFQYFSRDAEVRFLAPKGTVIAEDTRGLHKGLELHNDDRLMLQLQFSNSLFGGSYAPSSFRTMTREMAAMTKAYPGIYRDYLGALHG